MSSWTQTLLVLACALGAPVAMADSARETGAGHSFELTVHIDELRNSRGRVAVALFDSAKHFPEQEHALQGQVSEIAGKRASVTFRGLKAGGYAVAVLHDENRNNKMDFNFVGMPLEGYGFSRDAAVVFGPPSFESAVVRVVAARSKIRVKSRYFSL